MMEVRLNKTSTRLDQQILRTLLYFDIFNYPLKSEEIFRFLQIPLLDESLMASRLASLKDQKIIFQFGELFSLKNDNSFIERRLKGNNEADKYLILARKKSNLISKFPFVRAVLASGSLSKGYMDERSDIDFFVVTTPNRLWIARTLLVLYKRVFLANSHKHFCVNYLVDEKHLEIEEKNLFTATELATVIPLYGSEQYEILQETNSWLTEFFPNYSPRSLAGVPPSKLSWPKKVFEGVISLFFADTLERYLQNKTLSRWKRLYEKSYAASDFKVAFKSKSYASKNHPQNFQRTVIEVYDEKVRAFGLHPKASDDAFVFPMNHESVLNSNAGI